MFISGSAHTQSISTLLQETPQILSSSFLRSALDAAEQAFDTKFEVRRGRGREGGREGEEGGREET